MIRLLGMMKFHKPGSKCANNCKNKAGKPRGVIEIQCGVYTTVTLNKLRCWTLPCLCPLYTYVNVAFYCMLHQLGIFFIAHKFIIKSNHVCLSECLTMKIL